MQNCIKKYFSLILVLALAVLVPFLCDFKDLLDKYFAMNSSSASSTWYLVISTIGIYHARSPVVHTNLGDVQGIISNSREGRSYFEYKGIPFATPPINNLRFEAPVPAKPWEGVLKAEKTGSPCLQYDAMVKGVILGHENCLFTSVYTPNIKPEKLMPVIAYIHGGGFTSGESGLFHAKYLMDHNVVVVTFNYRLASLGFMNTGDDKIRGNMGLKDQRMALHFIKDNIQFFGGDPTQVTLMGESAGAASVHYHVISPSSRGLFSRAIIQSGNLACPWAFTKNATHQALKFGKIVGCPTDNTTIMVDCLKKMDGRDIVKHHEIIMSPVHTQDDFFPGSIEAVIHDDTFLSENPLVMLERGDFAHIPVIFGVNSGEGGLKTARLESYHHILDELDIKWNEHIPVLMHYDPNRTDVSEKLRAHYFGAGENDLEKSLNPSENLLNLTKMFSAGIFFEGQHRVAKYHSKYAPTYLYYFSYLPQTIPSTYVFIRAAKPQRWYYPWEANMAQGILGYYSDKYVWRSKDPKKYGACHGEDVGQVWSFTNLFDIRTSSKDYPFSKAIVNSFVQFAKNESNLQFANVTWPSINSSDEKHIYMQMDKQGTIIEEPFEDDVKFIESLKIRDPLDPINW